MGEFPSLCAAVYGGLLMGALYDALRPLRLFLRGKFWNALLDALYYAMVLCLAGFTLFYINGGVPRFYLLAGMGLGAYLYARLVSRFLLALGRKLKKTVAHKRRMD